MTERVEQRAVTEKPGLDLDELGPGRGPDGGPERGIVEQPLWLIRLKLFGRSLLNNWKLFTENKVGLVGLGIILFFALMAIAHPFLMGWVWQPHIYDPVIGYDAPIVEKEVVELVENPVTQVDLFRARLEGRGTEEVGDIIEVREQPAPPTRTHLLGTDPLGRDVLSQLMFSTRAAFALGVIAALVTVFIATTVGSIAAYFAGWIDSALMRLADLILLVPIIPLLIVLSAMFTVTLPTLGLLIGILSGFGGTAIVLKSQALSVKVKPFIDAARVAGGGKTRIIARHIMPNVMPLSFLYMMFTVTEAISLEAVLSFFGLINVSMSWGIMIHTAQTQGYLLAGTAYWWLLLPAGMAVTLLAAAFFLVGRAMDEVVNPRLRER